MSLLVCLSVSPSTCLSFLSSPVAESISAGNEWEEKVWFLYAVYMLAKINPPHTCLGGTLNRSNMWDPGSSGSLQTGSSQQRLQEWRGHEEWQMHSCQREEPALTEADLCNWRRCRADRSAPRHYCRCFPCVRIVEFARTASIRSAGRVPQRVSLALIRILLGHPSPPSRGTPRHVD